MEEFKNYYNIIGLNPSEVSPETVKKAFRAKLMEIRPDLKLDLETRARFADLQEARATLENPLKRWLYEMEVDAFLLEAAAKAIMYQVNSLEKEAQQIVREAGKLR